VNTQNIVDSKNLPTFDILAKAFSEYGVDVMYKLRFEVGEICHDQLRELMRLQELFCSDYCYIDDDGDRRIRETIIKNSIRKIGEL